ncbi:MAG: DUF5331 domain-containing protein [Merismopediaceae bacterium]|nr:DUF5331 domain-containing protein [Merismopediaceae bacterium]
MSNFETIKAILKDKWLDYYQDNQLWILKMSGWQFNRRPNSSFILGVISVLYPKIIKYLTLMIEIDEKGNNIVTELGLEFDPRDEIKKRNDQIGFQEFLTKNLPNELADCLTEKDFLDEIFNLKDRLKDLWLDYFQYHQSWLINHECWVKCSSSEETRPIAYLILGVMSVIEPRLRDYLIPLYGLNSSGEEIVKVLNLDFSPETELEKREEERKSAQEATLMETSSITALLATDPEYRAVHEGLEEIRAHIRQQENSS